MSDETGVMNKLLLAALLLTAAAPATAANRNFGVSGFDRIRVDGDYKVVLTVGAPPSARASGSMRALDPVDIVVEGRTLVVRTKSSAAWGGYPGESAGPVEVTVGTHELTAAFVNGAGSLSINKVHGLKFEASAQGAGSIAIDKVEVDQLQLALAGAASARLAGTAIKLTATVRGSSSLDGEALAVKDAVIGAQGPAIVTLTATGTAKVDAIGVAAVKLTGKPSCIVNTKGSASVSGCR